MYSSRALCVSALVAVLTPAFALDYQTTGGTLGKVVPELAAATELNLTVAPQVINEVVIVRAKNVDKFDLLQRVADATGLAWIKTDEGFRLDKTNEITLTSRQAFANFTQAMVSEGDPNGMIKAPSGASDSLLNVVGAMPASAISSLDIGGRIVFSTRPTRYQTTFPGGSFNAALAEIKGLQQAQIDEMNRRMAGRRIDERTQQVLDQLKVPVTKAYLVVQRMGFNTFRFDLVGLVLPNIERVSTSRTVSFTSYPPASSTADLSKWKLDANSTAKRRLESFSGAGGREDSLKGELKKMLLDPVTNEPVAFAIGPAMVAGAPEGVNFVACLPDEELESIASGLSLHGFGSLTATSNLFELKQDASWVTIKPRLTHHTWATRRNRAAFAQISQEFDKHGILNLGVQAAYAPYANNYFGSKGWDQLIGRRILGQPFATELGVFQYSSLESLEMYNSLKNRMGNSNRQVLPLNALNTAWLNYVIFNSTSGPERNFGNNVPRGVEIQSAGGSEVLVQTDSRIAPQANRQASRERTEFLAQGLPVNGEIQITNNTTNVVIGRSIDRTIQMTLNEGDLVTMRAAQLSSNVRTRTGLLGLSSNEFGITRRVQYQFEVRYVDGTVLRRTVAGTIPATTFVSYDKLPQDMLSRIERQATQMATDANNRNNGRDRTPPPQS